MHASVGWLALAAAIAPPALAVEAPARETILIEADKLVVRPGKVLENTKVLVQGGRIRAVGTDLEAPEGARVVRGPWVCAAYFDAWSALGLEPGSLAELGCTPATRALDGLDQGALRHLHEEALRAGITLVRVQSGAGARIGGLGAVVRVAPGLPPAEQVVQAESNLWMSAGLSQSGGAQLVEEDDGFRLVVGERAQDPFERTETVDRIVSVLQAGLNYVVAKNEHRHELEEWKKKIAEKEAELDKEFKKAKKDREKAQKDAEEKGKEFQDKKYKEDKRPQAPRFDEDNEVAARVIDGLLPLFVQAEREAEIRALLQGTAQHGRLQLVLAGGSESLWHAEELAERRISVLVWPSPLGRERADEREQHDLSLAGRLSKAGVDVLLGSGGRDPAATRDLPLLAGLAVSHGLPREQAFEALTLGAARALRLDARFGSVEANKEADLIVLDGEPLSSTSRVLYTISAGRVVAAREE